MITSQKDMLRMQDKVIKDHMNREKELEVKRADGDFIEVEGLHKIKALSGEDKYNVV